MNGQDDLPARRRFDDLMQRIFAFQKRPQSLPEANLYCRWNVASTAMVRLVDGQKRA